MSDNKPNTRPLFYGMHMRKVATAIHAINDPNTREEAAIALARMFALENAAFDTERFMSMCVTGQDPGRPNRRKSKQP